MNTKKNGQVMILTVLVMGGVILSASAIIGYLTFSKLRQAGDFSKSAKAIFAADAGIEWELYKYFRDATYPKPVFNNNSDFDSVNNGVTIKSIGSHINVLRAFEMQLAGATTTLPALPN
ncbi:MAG: hypothetical protein AAB498_02495 [Patescibacteria group bacterium]